jgi:hypothetical protein
MKLQLVPARRGALWVRHGFQAFFHKPLAFSGLFGVFLLAMLVSGIVPLIGPVVFLACLPLVTLGFMLATQQVLQGRFPGITVFSSPLRIDKPRTQALVKLGIAYAVAMLLILALRAWLDNGRSEALQAALMGGTATPESVRAMLEDSRLQLSVLSFFGLASLLSVPFWHAPGLIHWGGQGMAQSLFFSTMACWRNKGAFVVYTLTWAAVLFGFVLFSSLLFAVLGQPQWAPFVMMPAALLMSTVFYASLYFTFADCFELPAAPGASPP